jgi:hypothetical protein
MAYKDNLLGRRFNSTISICEIPSDMNFDLNGNGWFRHHETFFSGEVYSKTDNNTFMLFVALWFREIKSNLTVLSTPKPSESLVYITAFHNHLLNFAKKVI